jgi:hypothetical protein
MLICLFKCHSDWRHEYFLRYGYLHSEPIRINDGEQRDEVHPHRINNNVASAHPVLVQVVSATGCHVTFRHIPAKHFMLYCFVQWLIYNIFLQQKIWMSWPLYSIRKENLIPWLIIIKQSNNWTIFLLLTVIGFSFLEGNLEFLFQYVYTLLICKFCLFLLSIVH